MNTALAVREMPGYAYITVPVILRIAYVDRRAGKDRPNIDLGVQATRDRGVNVRAFATVAQAASWLAEQVGQDRQP